MGGLALSVALALSFPASGWALRPANGPESAGLEALQAALDIPHSGIPLVDGTTPDESSKNDQPYTRAYEELFRGRFDEAVAGYWRTTWRSEPAEQPIDLLKEWLAELIRFHYDGVQDPAKPHYWIPYGDRLFLHLHIHIPNEHPAKESGAEFQRVGLLAELSFSGNQPILGTLLIEPSSRDTAFTSAAQTHRLYSNLDRILGPEELRLFKNHLLDQLRPQMPKLRRAREQAARRTHPASVLLRAVTPGWIGLYRQADSRSNPRELQLPNGTLLRFEAAPASDDSPAPTAGLEALETALTDSPVAQTVAYLRAVHRNAAATELRAGFRTVGGDPSGELRLDYRKPEDAIRGWVWTDTGWQIHAHWARTGNGLMLHPILTPNGTINRIDRILIEPMEVSPLNAFYNFFFPAEEALEPREIAILLQLSNRYVLEEYREPLESALKQLLQDPNQARFMLMASESAGWENTFFQIQRVKGGRFHLMLARSGRETEAVYAAPVSQPAPGQIHPGNLPTPVPTAGLEAASLAPSPAAAWRQLSEQYLWGVTTPVTITLVGFPLGAEFPDGTIEWTIDPKRTEQIEAVEQFFESLPKGYVLRWETDPLAPNQLRLRYLKENLSTYPPRRQLETMITIGEHITPMKLDDPSAPTRTTPPVRIPYRGDLSAFLELQSAAGEFGISETLLRRMLNIVQRPALSRGGVVWVKADSSDGTFAGSMIYLTENPTGQYREYTIVDIAVEPGFKHSGVSRAFITHLDRKHHAPPGGRTVAYVRSNDSKTRAFFEALGFEEEETVPNHFGEEEGLRMIRPADSSPAPAAGLETAAKWPGDITPLESHLALHTLAYGIYDQRLTGPDGDSSLSLALERLPHIKSEPEYQDLLSRMPPEKLQRILDRLPFLITGEAAPAANDPRLQGNSFENHMMLLARAASWANIFSSIPHRKKVIAGSQERSKLVEEILEANQSRLEGGTIGFTRTGNFVVILNTRPDPDNPKAVVKRLVDFLLEGPTAPAAGLEGNLGEELYRAGLTTLSLPRVREQREADQAA